MPTRPPVTQRRIREASIAAALLTATWATELQGSPRQPGKPDSPAGAETSISPGTELAPVIDGGKSRGRFSERTAEQALRFAQTTKTDTDEVRAQLSQEQQKVQALTQDLRASRRELGTVLNLLKQAREQWLDIADTADSQATKLRNSLQEENERAQRLEQELAAARRDLQLQAELTAKANGENSDVKQTGARDLTPVQKLLQEERDHASQLERDLATARRDLQIQAASAAKASEEENRAKEAAQRGCAELQALLQQQRDKAEQLEKALATTRRELESQSSVAKKSIEEADQLKQTAKASLDKANLSLKSERDRAEDLAQQLSLARTKLYAYEAQTETNHERVQTAQQPNSSAAELEKLLHQERDRSGQLEQELAIAHRALQAQLDADRQFAATELPQRESWTTLLNLPQVNDPLSRDRSLPFSRVPSAAQSMVAADQSTAEYSPRSHTAALVASATSTGNFDDLQFGAEQQAEISRLMEHATLRLRQGDIGAARTFLERASELGSAQATFALAETYDPQILPKWGAYGTRSDASRARELYTKAEAAGITEAKQRFEALGR